MKSTLSNSLLALLLVALISSSAVAAGARTWTDSTGKHKIKAEFVELVDGTVTLLRDSGKQIKLPLAKLSAADRRLVAELTSAATTPPPSKQPSGDDLLKDLKMVGKAQWSRMISVSEDGTQQPASLDLIVELTGPAAEKASAYGMAKVKPAMTAAGKRLNYGEHHFDDPTEEYLDIEREGHFADHPKDGVHVKFEYENPGAATKGVKEFSGTFKLRTGGEISEVEVTCSLKGAIKCADLTAAKVSLSASQNDRSQLAINVKGDKEAIANIELVDASGNEPAGFNGSGTGSFNGNFSYDFYFEKKVPAGLKLKITLRTGQQVISVPFKFENLEVTGS